MLKNAIPVNMQHSNCKYVFSIRVDPEQMADLDLLGFQKRINPSRAKDFLYWSCSNQYNWQVCHNILRDHIFSNYIEFLCLPLYHEGTHFVIIHQGIFSLSSYNLL